MNASYWWPVLALATAQTPPTRVVLLDDFSVVEGAVQAVGGYVRITPVAGPPKLVAANQVLFEAATRDDVYTFVAGKADQTTAAGLSQLAAWCEKVGMLDRAVAHARAAAGLAPADAKLAGYVRTLEQKLAAQPTPSAVRQASAAVPVQPPTTPPVAVAPAAAAAFGARIQPILFNLCATCHAHKTYNGAFKLARIPDGYANTEATAANLQAVVGQLNRADSPAAPLLVMALTLHGGQKRPALTRGHPAFHNLESWAMAALPSQPVAVPQAEPGRLPPLQAEPLPGAVVGATRQRPLPAVTPAAGVQPVTLPKPPAPAATPNPGDPFDPAEFNRLPKRG